jgi:hypothetical protein
MRSNDAFNAILLSPINRLGESKPTSLKVQKIRKQTDHQIEQGK